MYIPITFIGTDGTQNLCVSASSTATEESVFLSGSHVWQYWKFETSGSNSLTIHTGSSIDAQIFLVGGGGGGGVSLADPTGGSPQGSGGGGGGGVAFFTEYKLQSRTYDIEVGGGGGAGQPGQDTSIYPLYDSAKNENEYFPNPFYLTGEGGGEGSYSSYIPDSFGRYAFNAKGGGSGGGGSRGLTLRQPGSQYVYETALYAGGRTGQGNQGGDVIIPSGSTETFQAGCGGGGAAEAGQPADFFYTANTKTRGGNAIQYNVDGVLRYYGAGGGGCSNYGWPSGSALGANSYGAGGSGSFTNYPGGNPGTTDPPDSHDTREGRDGIAVVMVPICSASLLQCTTYELYGEGTVTYLPCGSGSEATLESFEVEAGRKYRVCSYSVPSINGTVYPLTDTCAEVNPSGSCSETDIPIDITPPLPNNVHMRVTPIDWSEFTFDYEGASQTYHIGSNRTTKYPFIVDYDTKYWSRDGVFSNSENIAGQSILGIDLNNTLTGSCQTMKFSSTEGGGHSVQYKFCDDYPTSATQYKTFTGAFTHYASVDTTQPIITSSNVTACYYSQSFNQNTATTSSQAYNVRVTVPSSDGFNKGNFSYINVDGELVSHSISTGTSQDLVMQSIPVHRKTTPPTPFPVSTTFEILSPYTGSFTSYPYYNSLNDTAQVRIYGLWPATGSGTYYNPEFNYWNQSGTFVNQTVTSPVFISSSVIPSVWGTSGYVSDETWRIEPSPYFALHDSIPVTRSIWSLIDLGLTASYDGTGSTLHDISGRLGEDRIDATFNSSAYEYNTAVLDSGSLILEDSGSVSQIQWNRDFDNWNNDMSLLITWFNNGSEPEVARRYNLFGTTKVISTNPYTEYDILNLSPDNVTTNLEYANQSVRMRDAGILPTGSDNTAAESGFEFVGWHIHQVSYNRATKTINWMFDDESGSVVCPTDPIFGDTDFYQYTPVIFNNNRNNGVGIPSAIQVFAIYTGSLSLSEMQQNYDYLYNRY